MHSIRKYRNWAVLLLVVLASTAVVASTPGQSMTAQSNAAVAPSGITSPTLTTTGPVQVPSAISPARHPEKDGRNVAFMAADYTPLSPTLYDSLVNYYGETVTRINVMNYTPDVDEMNQYEVIICWSNYAFQDPEAMGNNLADYIDGGGRVIQSTFSWYGTPGWGMGGRLKSETPYQTFNYSTSYGYGAVQSDWYDSGHPITQDLGDPVTTYYHNYVNVVSTALKLADYTTGYDFVAVSENEGCIGINMYVGSASAPAGPWCRLYYNAIEWSIGPPLHIDVGVAKIVSPAPVQDPGTPVTPVVRIKNFGDSSATNIPMTFRIWDPTPNLVYTDDQTYTGTLGFGDTVSVPFADWTPGSEITYTCTTFTWLDNDEKLKNDTGKMTVATIGWKDIQPPTDDANRLVHGTVFDNDHDMLYMMGGNTDGYAGTNLTRMQRYDPIAEVWSNRAAVPTGLSWIHGSYANGKVYVIAGMNNSSQATDANNAYDVTTNEWSTAEKLPRTSLAYLEAKYDNRLIYIMGGMDASYNACKTVNIYDPASNSWTTGTDMPKNADMGSAAIIGDTIYIAEAYERSAGQCWPNLYKGAINPGDPTQITWTAGPALSPNVACGATAAIDEVVYWMGGFTDNFYYVTDKIWKYSQETGAIEEFTVAKYGSTIARNNYMVARVGGKSELYALAGDLGGNWSSPNNWYKRLTLPPKNNDVGVAWITVPTSAQLTPGETFKPTCYVKNYGKLDQVDAPCSLHVFDASGAVLYAGVALVSPVSGDSALAEYDDITIPDSLFIGRTFAFETFLAGDQRPFNNYKALKTMTLADEVYSYADMPAPVIDGYIDPSDEWADAYTFDCSNIFGWKGIPQGPGAAYAYFKNDDDYLYVAFWMPGASSRDIGDKVGLCIDENNDGAWAGGLTEGEYQIWVNGSGADEVQYRYHAPNGTIGQWTSVVGSQSASSSAGGLFFEARIPIGSAAYKLTLDDPKNDTVGLYLFGQDGGNYYGWFKAGLADGDWNTPSLYGKLVFKVLQPPQQGNIAVTKIIAPVNCVPNTEVIPKATWKNTGTTPMNFTAYMFLADPTGARVYTKFQPGMLEGGQSVDLTFDPYTVVDTGTWGKKCSTVAAGDINPADDVLVGTFRVSEAAPPPPGWKQVADIPLMPSGRAVKDGGCLAYDAGTDAIYASKGYKTGDFYKYELPDNWTILASVPFGGDGKQVYKGSVICADGNGKMYLVKGNNTMGFWEYDAASNAWTQLSDVPYGESGKKVKQGSGIAWAQGAAYLLKGYRNEFYKYDPAAGWITLTPAPIGWHKKWDAGSWLVSDGDHTLYAFKGKYHEFYTYNTQTGEWSPALTAMPIPGRAGNKKAKDGSSAAWFDGDIYAFKGGNTTEFWKYFPDGDSWVQQADIPMYGNSGRRKKVKQGGALAGYPGAGGVYAFKGNKTYDFWRYGVTAMAGAQPSREGVMAGNINIGDASFAISPNPLAGGLATVRYSLPKAGLATLYVYDVTGRTVLTQTLAAGRTGTAGLDLRKLDAGVYLVKVTTEGFSATQKLVVEH